MSWTRCRLEKYALTAHDVIAALGENNASFSGGFVEPRSERLTVRGVGLVRGVSDLEQIVLTSVEGVPVFVRDVADVRIGAMPRQGAVTRNGQGESVAGMVIILKGENGREVGARVKARIAEIQKTLPHGVTLRPFYDQTEVIDRTSHTVRKQPPRGLAARHRACSSSSCATCGPRSSSPPSSRSRCCSGSSACASSACRRTSCRSGRSTSA